MVISHPLSADSIYYYPPCSIHVPDSLFPQSLSKFSLVYLLAWHPPLHTPYISSPNYCLLFATHAHTTATCFAVVPRNLMSSNPSLYLSTFYLEFCLVVSHHTSVYTFSSLPAEVPPHFPFLRVRSHFHEHTASHTTAVQSPSNFQWYILIGKQWNQLPEFIPSNSYSYLYRCWCISISVYSQHITQITKLIHWLQICIVTHSTPLHIQGGLLLATVPRPFS